MAMTFRRSLSAVVLSAAVLSAPVGAHAFEIKDEAAFDKLVHDYIVDHPEVLLEAQDALQKKQEAAKREQVKAVIAENKDAIFHAPGDVVLGNPNGDVSVVEFFDYNCPYCKHAIDDMNAILEADKNVRFVLKEFPILGPDSIAATHVSLAFREIAPQKYRQFFDTLLGGSARADADRAFAVAKTLGVDRKTLEQKMKDPAIEAEISKAYSLANDLGLTGTPAYIVGDEAVSGALGAQVLLQKIGNVRKCDSTVCS